MARKIRLFVKDTPQHVVIRGINNKVIFLDEEDYQTFLAILKGLVKSIEIELHAYILMPTYFQFLATPLHTKALSKFMQTLGRQYVGYFNKKYERKGTLWEGRYKSSLIESQKYLYEVMKFIETKPKDFRKYLYSSIQKNIFSKDDAIVTLHKQYTYKDYNAVLENSNENIHTIIASSLEKQTVTGSFAFTKRLEQEIGILLVSQKRGRPALKHKIKRKKMYNNLVIINKTKHQDLKLLAVDSLSFAKELEYLPTVASEVSSLAKDYPVVFRIGETSSLISLISLDGTNLAISSDGKWHGAYIPLYIRKYPFALGATEDNPEQKLIMIDENSSLVSTTEGEALFSEDGERTKRMENVMTLLSHYETQRVSTQKMIQTLIDANILERAEISVGEGEEKKLLLQGFQVVNQKKLELLDSEVTKDWEEQGINSFIDEHLKSLNNIKKLFALASKQQS